MGLLLSLLLVAAATWTGATYNGLVALRDRWRGAFARLDAELARRHELISGLVESARGRLGHERETLDAVARACAAAVGARGAAASKPGDVRAMRGLADAEAALGSALGRLMAVVDADPGLTADPTVAGAREALAGIEGRIEAVRQAYDDGVTGYNARVARFPVSLVASAFGFARAEPLAATGTAIETGRRPPSAGH